MFSNENKIKPKEHQTVVRVSTNYWFSNGCLSIKKNIRLLKRKSFGFNLLEEECNNQDPEDVVFSILNLSEVYDGVYELITCNTCRDWETGYVDSYDLMLVPYKD